MSTGFRFLSLVCCVAAFSQPPAGAAATNQGQPTWRVGTAAIKITPPAGLWMAGYAVRSKPAEATEIDLWLKVLALEDSHGKKGVIITSDLLGFPQKISNRLVPALSQKFSLNPDQVILSASHTHCGPVLRESAMDMYALDAGQRSRLEAYSSELELKVIEGVGKAISNLEPARLSAGAGTTGFAVNRRNNLEKEIPDLLPRDETVGPVDRSVPVLGVFLPDGTLKAVLFGYACHNTVMDYYKWSGDYSGFAQLALEKQHPGATALFFMGCGGDQNPLPRRKLFLAERYGAMLAAAVEETLIQRMRSLRPDLRTGMETIDLALGASPTASELENLASTNSPPTTRRWATRLLNQIKEGKPLARTYPYPVQAWQLGEDQLLVTLGGEPVVDYALKFKKEFGPNVWVAGYCNDVMAYIPSLRVLKEDDTPAPKPGWGYEGSRSMMVYGLPALRWSEQVEEQVTLAVRRAAERVGAKASTAGN